MMTSAAGYSNSSPLSVSSNGMTVGTGILWASSPYSGDANRGIVPGILRAFDAADLSAELWDSKMNANRDDVGNYAKFVPPTIANGKVYLATFSNQLLVYGLLNSAAIADFSIAATAFSPASISSGASATSTVTITPSNGLTGTINFSPTSCTGLPAGATCSFNPSSITLGSAPVASTLTIATTGVTPAGTFDVNISATSGAISHTTTVTLITVPPSQISGFSLGVSPNSASVNSGSSARYTISAVPQNGFAGVLSLTCSVPSNAKLGCSFNPTSITPGVTSTLTVTSTASTVTLLVPNKTKLLLAYALSLAFLLVTFVRSEAHSRRVGRYLVLIVMIALVTGCGGGSSSTPSTGGAPGTPVGNYNVVVTGTSGSLTQSVNVALTVQ
ncbi:MAG: hypothetical protein JOZ80_17470 [Acidobacteriaceae bacterium]|nr:hypothetical protein [Acidobacteriaceae bacterium]